MSDDVAYRMVVALNESINDHVDVRKEIFAKWGVECLSIEMLFSNNGRISRHDKLADGIEHGRKLLYNDLISNQQMESLANNNLTLGHTTHAYAHAWALGQRAIAAADSLELHRAFGLQIWVFHTMGRFEDGARVGYQHLEQFLSNASSAGLIWETSGTLSAQVASAVRSVRRKHTSAQIIHRLNSLVDMPSFLRTLQILGLIHLHASTVKDRSNNVGSLEESNRLQKISELLAEFVGHSEFRSIALSNQMFVATALKDPVASSIGNKSLKVMHSIGYVSQLASAEHGLAVSYAMSENRGRFLRHATNATELIASSRSPRLFRDAIPMTQLAESYLQFGDKRTAKSICENTSTIFQFLENSLWLSKSQAVLAQ